MPDPKYKPVSDFYKNKKKKLEKSETNDERKLNLLIKETDNANKDEEEFLNTLQIKNPKSIKYKNQKKELEKKKTYLTEDNRTDFVKKIDQNKGEFEIAKKEALKRADVVTDIAQLGNFVPHPAFQAIGKAGNVIGTVIDGYGAYDDFSKGDYINGSLNTASTILPNYLDTKSFGRNSKYSPITNELNNIFGDFGRTKYLNTLNQVKNQTTQQLNTNRALLGTLGAETIYDTQYAMGGNMKNNSLTQINEGGSHSQNPLGGVPMGRNNSVEQNETIKNGFVYSDRIILNKDIIGQYGLPKSLTNKTVADATKIIDRKFKDRNDKISTSTRDNMLSKIAEAQEAMKPAEPEMEQSQEGMIDPTQMALGGYVNRQMSGGGWYDQNNPYFMQNPGAVQEPAQSNTNVVNQIQPVSQLTQANSLSQIKPFSTGNQLPTASAVPDTAGAIGGGLKEMSGKTGLGLSSALGAASTAIDLGKTAFGKPAQDTSGLAPSAEVNSGGMIAGSAMKGASAGMAFGPWGAGIGAVVGAGAGLLGSGKAKKAALVNSKNFAIRTNSAFTNDFAYGGKMYAGGGPLDSLGPVPLADDLIKPTTIEDIKKYQASRGLVVDGDFGKNSKKQFELDKKNWSPEIPDTSSLISGNRWDKEINPGILDNKIIDSTIDPLEYSLNKDTLKDPYKLPKANLSKLGDTLGQAARYAPIAMNAYQLSQLKKPAYERLNKLDARFKPEYVDERSLQNIAGNEYDNTVNAITQMGGGEGATRNAILGAGLNKTKALSDAYINASGQNRQMNMSGQQFNLGVDQVNLNQANSELDINDRNQAAYRNAKREYLTGIGEGIGDVGKEEVYKKIAKTTTGYSWLGEFQKMNPNATKEETIIAAKKAGVVIDDDKTAKKQALGGYLIKNKVK